MTPIVLRRAGSRHLAAGFWSLLPPWAQRLDYANEISTFNAKAETLAQRSSFKNAFLKRRCIVPAEAFYEWLGPRGKKQPLHIARRDGHFLSMAGLFSYWKQAGSQGRPIPTFTIVTTEPNQWMARIHKLGMLVFICSVSPDLLNLTIPFAQYTRSKWPLIIQTQKARFIWL